MASTDAASEPRRRSRDSQGKLYLGYESTGIQGTALSDISASTAVPGFTIRPPGVHQGWAISHYGANGGE